MYLNDIDLMTSAYKLLYRMETYLKQGIDKVLSKTHGVNWQFILRVNRDIDNLYLSDIIGYYGKYQELTTIFSDSQRTELYHLVSIRNKVAHMKLISTNEYEALEKCFYLVEEKLSSILSVNVDSHN